MYYLAEVFPIIRKLKIPLKRSQVMLLMLALNFLLLGVETYTAHIVSGTIVPYEWIPIIYGPLAAVILLATGVVSLKKRQTASLIANIVFVVSIVVGLLGMYFHLSRGIVPGAPAGEKISIILLIWSPPAIAPLTFALLGLLGISSTFIEHPVDSGRLLLWKNKTIQLPLPKTSAFLLMSAFGNLATLISSVLDHARTDYSNLWLWVPTIVGLFGTLTAFYLGVLKKPRPEDIAVFIAAMVLMIVTGLLGVVLHYLTDVTAGGKIVIERFIRGAPIMAPMLFADMGAIGLIALLDPHDLPEKAETEVN